MTIIIIFKFFSCIVLKMTQKDIHVIAEEGNTDLRN